MSLTVTITQTEAAPVYHITLVLRPPPERVSNAVEDMMDSRIFEGKELAIRSWEAAFLKAHAQDLETEIGRQNASLSICYMICDIIRPLIIASREDMQLKLLEFEDRFKDILGTVLPSKEDLEKFLQEYEESSYEEEQFHRQITLIEAENVRLIQKIYDTANAANNALMKQREQLLDKLSKLNAHRQKMTEEMQKRLEKLSEKMRQPIEKQVALIVKAQAIGEQAQAQIAQDKKTIEQALQTLQ